MPEIIGTDEGENLDGTGDADTISGLGGDDYLVGAGGRDSIEGGPGNDTIEGDGAGDSGDTIDGGEGRDQFAYYGGDSVTIDLGAGTTSFGTGPDAVPGAALVGIEDAWGDVGDDLIRGDAGTNRLRGYDGANTLEGAAGDDALEGEDGDDSLAGGGGDDTLDGGGGSDVASFSGNRGEYAITVHYGADNEATHVTVADRVAGRDGTDTILLGAAGATVETMRFADGEADVICFMPGTLVATPAGEAPVETLKRGDPVLTADGRAAPVVWMGRQTVSRRFADPLRVLPIRIGADALGEGLPRRDLLVSPDHALFLDGVLVHAGALVNGSTIRREEDVPEIWTSWHVELADHALLLAEGVAAETFVDNAERLNFDNWAEHQALHGGERPIEELPLPRAKSHRQVPQSLRRRIAARAEAASSSAAAA